EVLDTNTSLETTISEWVKTYRADSTKGMLELVNFLIHSCGCNSSVSPSAFAEEDAVVDILQELQQELQKDPFHDYPIVSRARHLKKFRRQFLDFWTRLIDQCRHDVVYNGVFCETLQEWLTAMSSSTFRPFRHTATATALCLVGALCDVARAVEGELEVATRQLQAERKKRGEKTRVGEREQGLVDRSQDLHGKKVKLGEVLTDFFDGVFVHRCRDVEPIIRSECIRDLGTWMIKHPTQFLDASYLRYLGWLLSDKSPSVRLEAIRSLERLYLKDDFVSSLRQFTERFRGRVIEMAVGEADLTIRTVAIKVCETVSRRGFLEETEKEALCPLVFEAEEKVRSAVSGFVKDVVNEDWVAKKSAEVLLAQKGKKKKDAQVREDWIELKGLAAFFVKFDGSTGREKDGEEEMNGKKRKRKDAAKDIVDDAYVEGGGSRKVGRIAEAVEALWWEMEVLRVTNDLHYLLQDWETLADYLSRDHSTSQAAQSSSVSTPIDPCYRLTDEEESVLVEVFVACLKLAIERGNEKEKAKEKKKVSS
ncbi:STAG domain-containing protein, partial [Endogone sp. FLAS-F59071]